MTRLVLCDLDGTLLRPGHGITSSTLSTLAALRERDVVVALASGRSLYAGRNCVKAEMPVDFWIFSTGVGVVTWPQREIVRRCELSAVDTARIAEVLRAEGEAFMIQAEVPDNHCFVYEQGRREEQTDFGRRCELYRDFCRPFREEDMHTAASQFIAVLPPDEERLERLRRRLQGYSVVRATSPLDGVSVWLEIFRAEVSKGQASRWLAEEYLPRHGRTVEAVYALGNDYNDEDMLSYAQEAMLTPHSPLPLQRRFAVTAADSDGALAEAAERWGLL